MPATGDARSGPGHGLLAQSWTTNLTTGTVSTASKAFVLHYEVT